MGGGGMGEGWGRGMECGAWSAGCGGWLPGLTETRVMRRKH